MSVRVVSMSFPELAHCIYADRVEVSRDGSIPRPPLGLYFIKEGEPLRVLKEELVLFADDVVAVSSREVMGSDTALATPESYVQEIAMVRKIRPAKDVAKKVEGMARDSFCTFVRFSCVLRRWYREAFQFQDSPYLLFESLVNGKKEFLFQYFWLRRSRSAHEILASVLTFLSRVDLYEDQKDSLSEVYRALVRKGRNQGMQLANTARRLLRTSDEIDPDSRVIHFCLSLRS